jgi:hypothetical protein
MPAKSVGHLSKKNLKQHLASKNAQAPKAKKPTEQGNRSKKTLATRAKTKKAVLARRRIRARKAQGK